MGAVSAGLNGVLASALPGFALENPNILLKVREIDGRQIQVHMGEDALDVLLCRAPDFILEGWKFMPLMQDKHVLMVAPSHPLVGRRGLTLADMSGCLWLTPPRGVPALEVFERLMAKLDDPVLCRIETRSSVIMRETVRHTDAVMLAPLSIFHADVAAGTLAVLDHDVASQIAPVGMLVRTEATIEATARLARYLERKCALDGAP